MRNLCWHLVGREFEGDGVGAVGRLVGGPLGVGGKFIRQFTVFVLGVGNKFAARHSPASTARR